VLGHGTPLASSSFKHPIIGYCCCTRTRDDWTFLLRGTEETVTALMQRRVMLKTTRDRKLFADIISMPVQCGRRRFKQKTP